MLDLTRREKRVIVFLIASLLLGLGIKSYKCFAYRPNIEIVPEQRIDNEIKESRIININTATENQLVRLRGVGPALAKAIIEYRTTHSFFNNKEELKNVKGIGQAKYKKIKEHIKIE